MKKRKSRIIKRTLASLALAGASAGIFALENSTKGVEKACEKYQGYNASSIEVDIVYVFDSEPKYLRTNRNAEFNIWGRPSLSDSLKIGKKYCFRYTIPSTLAGRREITSVELSE